MVCWGGGWETQGPKDGLVEDEKRRGGHWAESLRSTRAGFNVRAGCERRAEHLVYFVQSQVQVQVQGEGRAGQNS